MDYESLRDAESRDPHYWDHLPLSARMLFTEAGEEAAYEVAVTTNADEAKSLPVAVDR